MRRPHNLIKWLFSLLPAPSFLSMPHQSTAYWSEGSLLYRGVSGVEYSVHGTRRETFKIQPHTWRVFGWWWWSSLSFLSSLPLSRRRVTDWAPGLVLGGDTTSLTFIIPCNVLLPRTRRKKTEHKISLDLLWQSTLRSNHWLLLYFYFISTPTTLWAIRFFILVLLLYGIVLQAGI